MKNSTNSKINAAAQELVSSLIADYKTGGWSESELVRDRSKVKYPTNVEIVKMTIRKDLGKIRQPLMDRTGLDIELVSKNEETFNALSNRMCAILKRECKTPGLEILKLMAFTK